MLRLFFISAATHFKTARELNEIMRASRMRNRAEGVSSLLIYNDGSYAQLMEGPKQAVLNVFERIKKDKRHTGAAIIFQEETDTRITEGWDMHLLPVSKIAADDDYDFMTLAAFHASPQYEAAMAHPALRGFLASFKAVAKTPVRKKPEQAPAIASEPSISRTAAPIASWRAGWIMISSAWEKTASSGGPVTSIRVERIASASSGIRLVKRSLMRAATA